MILLSTKQTAEILGITVSMIRRLLRKDLLTGRKISPRCWLVYEDEKFDKYKNRIKKVKGMYILNFDNTAWWMQEEELKTIN